MYRGSRSASQPASAEASRRVPGRAIAATLMSSSVSSDGTPMAAASTRSGWAWISSSSSWADTFSPRRRMESLSRPSK
jgi:hypothetical protein